jgi:hypothetical protein
MARGNALFPVLVMFLGKKFRKNGGWCKIIKIFWVFGISRGAAIYGGAF